MEKVFVCPTCAGRGQIECPDCKGEGLVSGGYSQQRWKHFPTRCSTCNGEGYLPCPICSRINRDDIRKRNQIQREETKASHSILPLSGAPNHFLVRLLKKSSQITKTGVALKIEE